MAKYNYINADKYILSFILISIISAIVIVISVPDPTGYEISLYGSLPIIVWMLIFISQALNIIFYIFTDRCGWMNGIIVSCLLFITIIILPHIRGYHLFYTGDSLYHIGIVRSIVDNGQLQNTNIYPTIQILASFVVHITGLDVNQSAIILPIFISISFVMTGAILSFELPLAERGALLTTGLIITLPIGGIFYIFSPWAISQYIYICLLLWIVFSGLLLSTKGKLTAIIILITSIPIHPLTSLTLLIVLLFTTLVKMVSKPPDDSYHFGPTILLFLITGVSLIAWIITNDRLSFYLSRSVISILFPEAGVWRSTYVESAANMSNSAPSISVIVELFVFRYGKPVLLIGTSLLLILFNHFNDGFEHGFRTWIVYPLVVFWILGTSSILLPLPALGVSRLYAVALLFAILVIGYSISKSVGDNNQMSRFVLIVIVFVLLAAILLSTLTIYDSRGTKIPNQQIMKSEVSATVWSHQYIEGKRMFGISNKIERIATYKYGRFPNLVMVRPPRHFNWTSQKSREKRQDSGYLAVIPQDRQINPEFYPDNQENWQYNPDDFDRMNQSKYSDKVYSSDGIDIYLVDFMRYSDAE